MTPGAVHVIGAGLAGLSAAVRLSENGVPVTLVDSAPQAGGRCRSYFDKTLGIESDNGNHLVLSGNRETMAFLDLTGSRDQLAGPQEAAFSFVDLSDNARWTIRINDGPLGWWVMVPSRRVPGTRALDYLKLARLLRPARGANIGETLPASGPIWRRLLQPIMVSALNTEASKASAALAAAVVRQSLLRGGQACRPLVATRGLSRAFVDPALHFVSQRGGSFAAGRRLSGLGVSGGRVTELRFADWAVPVGPKDSVILAVPPSVAGELLPDLSVPSRFNPIINGHFLAAAPPDAPAVLGVVGGIVEWIFVFENRISVTVSNAAEWQDWPRETLAERLWQDVSAALKLDPALPRWQIVIEKRATISQTPADDALRPPAAGPWHNLFLAGDWVATGLPATIEGAILSGRTAATLARESMRRE